ncbi:hypothetical protein [Pasteuria penetrans]|uniref:hypothetical protein n=1 Tax=Pasteuria penetrans TaxID=86005 RepID=UPI0011ED7D7D|nr:hypothetical protein [Pasteuria penetrans]
MGDRNDRWLDLGKRTVVQIRMLLPSPLEINGCESSQNHPFVCSQQASHLHFPMGMSYNGGANGWTMRIGRGDHSGGDGVVWITTRDDEKGCRFYEKGPFALGGRPFLLCDFCRNDRFPLRP